METGDIRVRPVAALGALFCAALLVRTCADAADGADDASIVPYAAIQRSVAAGQHATAVSSVHEVLRRLSGSRDSRGLERPLVALTELAAQLRRAGAVAEANDCEVAILRCMNEAPVPPAVAYAVLKHALLHDQYHMVTLTTNVGGGSGAPGFATFELVHLQARATGTAFFEYDWMRKRNNEKRGGSASATREQAAQLRTMARRCTRLYEHALSTAPTAFEKAGIAAEWMALNVYPLFEADSQVLRAVLPTGDSFRPADGEARSRQIVQFRNAVEEALNRGTQGAQLTPEVRKDIVRLFPLEFEQFAGIAIPDAVADDVIADLDAFLDICLPLRYVEDATVFGQTMRWYLWNALTRSLPDEVERAAIDEQVRAFGSAIRTEIDRALAHADLKALGAEYEAKWLRSYHRLKDNRWIPYYKRAIPGYRLDWMTANLRASASETRVKFPREAARPDPWAKSPEEKTRAIEKAHSGYAFALYVIAWKEFARWDGPIYLPLPDAMIGGSTATLNDYGVYGFAVDDLIPLPPYPIKRQLSQEE